VDLEGDKGGTGNELPPEERRANKAAANFCVPADDLESFYIRKFPFIAERDVLGFAGRIQRHPGIVVGQLQKKMNRYDWLARHKVKIRHFLIGNSTVDGWGVPAPVNF
jgi:HTH-type transcriptional regulator/antitoxin HigA